MEMIGRDLALKRAKVADFLELTKPRITLLVLFTTLVGFYLASRGSLDWMLLLHTLSGTALVAGGANALNQYVERDLDARMTRTRNRPLPGRRVLPTDALIFSTIISVAGVSYLAFFVNVLTSVLGAATLCAYIFLYTPLKKRTALCTLVGAIPGATPPMMGWTAVQGQLDGGAWVLFAIVFLWQMPHFLAIAWVFNEDYARGGFSLLTVLESRTDSTSRQIILYCGVLLPVSLLPTLLGFTGSIYLWGALALGCAYLGFGLAVALFRSNLYARRLLRVSVVYLPALLGLMMIDKV